MDLIIERASNGGEQKVYRAANNYGASVVCHSFSYGGEEGLWELAVIEFDGDDWGICYTTPLTDDVLGYLTQPDVDKLLKQIEEL